MRYSKLGSMDSTIVANAQSLLERYFRRASVFPVPGSVSNPLTTPHKPFLTSAIRHCTSHVLCRIAFPLERDNDSTPHFRQQELVLTNELQE